MRSGIDRSRNLEEAERLIRKAAAEGAEFVSTPEMTTLLDQKRSRLWSSLEEPQPDESGVFASLSRELGITLHIGSLPTILEAQEKLANRALVFRDGALLARYDKVHLFDVNLPSGESWCESALYEGGGEAAIVKLPEALIGLSICYDLRFPQLYRRLAQGGAQILTVPAAFTASTGEAHWEVLLRARAIETGSFVVAAAQGGEHEDGRVTYGRSMIVAPWGTVLDCLPHDEPGLAMADCDLGEVEAFRSRIPSVNLECAPELRIYKA